MATFDAIDDYITQGTAVLAAAGTLMVWGKTRWAHTDGATHYLFTSFIDVDNFTSVYKFSDNSLYFDRKAQGNANRKTVTSGNYSIVAEVPFCLHFTWNFSTLLSQGYLNGVALGLETDLIGTNPGGAATRFIGNFDASEADAAMDEEHFTIWNRVLSASEILATANRASPLGFAPVNYLPLLGGDLTDYGSSPVNGTNNGTTTSNNVILGAATNRASRATRALRIAR